jgi:hypothetical protein
MEWREGLLQSHQASSLPVRGRDAQLSGLEEHLERVRSGVDSVVVIEDGPGGGTGLLQAAWACAEGMGSELGLV